MLKILVASPYLPWPPSEGGKAAQARTYEALRHSCRFTLVVPIGNEADDQAGDVFAKKFPEIKLRRVRCYTTAAPPPKLSMMRQVARWLKHAIFPPQKVTPVEAPAPTPAPYYPFGDPGRLFIQAIEEEFNEGHDLFQAEFADMMPLGSLMNGRIPTLFIHHQLHFMYCARFQASHAGGDEYSHYLTRRMKEEERAYLQAFDAVVVFSDVDRQLLEEFSPALRIHVSPFPSPEEALAEPQRLSAASHRFVFVASESHPPNVDGLCWFMREVWPAIRREIPHATMEVVGKWSEAKRPLIPSYQEIRFHGYVDDLTAALRGRVMVVPVWIGSGIRTKILAAWGACSPVVTTTIGAEGLPGKPDQDFLVGDEAESFAHHCIRIAADAELFNKIAANGLALVRSHFSLEAVAKSRFEAYLKTLNRSK